jgi:LacI family repressor for deo operon, udp, cdd, tsx, nupC, and nupG
MVLTRKTPTIQDVALRAQVSSATVSRVLSAPERVSEKTRERVNAAVRDTGYSINQAARSLRMKTARTLLMVAPNIGNPFYSVILDAVIDEAQKRGYGVLVGTNIGLDPGRWLTDYLLSTRADGLLLFHGGLDPEDLHTFAREEGISLPVVASYDEPPAPLVTSVVTDNRAAAARAVRYLMQLGHTKIGHLAGPVRNNRPNERLLGFVEAMTAANLPLNPAWILPGNYDQPGGIAAARAILALTERPTAMFCGNDESAFGFIHGLREGGVECPRDISVIGFDDVGQAEIYHPTLTTMRQPREDLGRVATRRLIDIIEKRETPTDPVHVVLPAELIIRESTRALDSSGR